MKYDISPEQIKAFEVEFVEWLENKDQSLYTIHEGVNKILSELPQPGILHYFESGGLVRAEITGENGVVFCSWYTTEDILGYSLAGAVAGMFGTPERIVSWCTGIALGVDIRERFIDMVNVSIDIVNQVSDEWEICIK